MVCYIRQQLLSVGLEGFVVEVVQYVVQYVYFFQQYGQGVFSCYGWFVFVFGLGVVFQCGFEFVGDVDVVYYQVVWFVFEYLVYVSDGLYQVVVFYGFVNVYGVYVWGVEIGQLYIVYDDQFEGVGWIFVLVFQMFFGVFVVDVGFQQFFI